MRKSRVPHPSPWVKGWPVLIFKITINYDRRLCEFWACPFKYPRPGSSLIVYTKLEGGLDKMMDRWTDVRTDRQTDRRTDRQTNRQTDRCIADICASLHIP